MPYIIYLSLYIRLRYDRQSKLKPCFQAREEFHAQLAASRAQQQHLQSSDLMDDSELLSDDRDLDADLTGKYFSKFDNNYRPV